MPVAWQDSLQYPRSPTLTGRQKQVESVALTV